MKIKMSLYISPKSKPIVQVVELANMMSALNDLGPVLVATLMKGNHVEVHERIKNRATGRIVFAPIKEKSCRPVSTSKKSKT